MNTYKMTAFEGSCDGLSLGYFGRQVEEFSGTTKEEALILHEGRRIHLTLNENGNGQIEVEDKKCQGAGQELGEDSFGGNYDKVPKGEYGFRQKREGAELRGVKKFLEAMLA